MYVYTCTCMHVSFSFLIQEGGVKIGRKEERGWLFPCLGKRSCVFFLSVIGLFLVPQGFSVSQQCTTQYSMLRNWQGNGKGVSMWEALSHTDQFQERVVQELGIWKLIPLKTLCAQLPLAKSSCNSRGLCARVCRARVVSYPEDYFTLLLTYVKYTHYHQVNCGLLFLF